LIGVVNLAQVSFARGALPVFGDGAWLGRMMLTLGHLKRFLSIDEIRHKKICLAF